MAEKEKQGPCGGVHFYRNDDPSGSCVVCGEREQGSGQSFRPGDRVSVIMSKAGGILSDEFSATVRSMPGRAGDLIEVDVPGYGRLGLNPNSSDFVAIVRSDPGADP